MIAQNAHLCTCRSCIAHSLFHAMPVSPPAPHAASLPRSHASTSRTTSTSAAAPTPCTPTSTTWCACGVAWVHGFVPRVLGQCNAQCVGLCVLKLLSQPGYPDRRSACSPAQLPCFLPSAWQGADLSRGLLQFAEGKPLGEHGMFWLYVQVCTGGGGWPRAARGSWIVLRLAAGSWLLYSPHAGLPRRRTS